jgi:hypothetical protein
MARKNPLGHDISRVLLALRAGPLAAEQIMERFGLAGRAWAAALVRAGYASRLGDSRAATYRITEAGLAACPPRNPALLTLRRQPPAPRGANVRGPTSQRIGAGRSTARINED